LRFSRSMSLPVRVSNLSSQVSRSHFSLLRQPTLNGQLT
jgi:hypothetical protein